MGSDENHFNVSVGSEGQSHKTVSTNHNLFEEKGRAEAVSNRGPSAYQLVLYCEPVWPSGPAHNTTQTPSTGLRHPSTTAVFSYAIGSRKLPANEQFFCLFVCCCCSDSSKNKANHLYPPTKFTPAQMKPMA